MTKSVLVVGRDLSVWGLGALGHIGLLASSNNIAQVMNETDYVNVVQNVTVANFKSADTYWGAHAKSSFKYAAGYANATAQLNALATQQRLHVAYTLTSSTPNPAVQVCSTYNSKGQCTAYTWKKGSFRCDAYVKWLYEKTTNGSLGGMTPNGSYNSSLLTITRA
ncbi:hypothetical protein [Acinetobacter rudis]|uniref:hypothetical protein n=1 Tax=Acinetobacter rudis TaxID=632955 RepID=UPI00334079F1